MGIFVAEARFERASSGYEPDEIPLLHPAWYIKEYYLKYRFMQGSLYFGKLTHTP